jgi:hypothetical protein
MLGRAFRLSVIALVVFPFSAGAGGKCGQRMTQTTCRQMTPQPPTEMYQRMITTALIQRQQQMQMTAVRQLVQQQMQMTAIRQMLQQQMPKPMPSQLVFRQPLQATKQLQTPLRSPGETPAVPATPITSTGELPTPLTKTAAPKTYQALPRSPEEKNAFCEAAFQRGLLAEQEGDFMQARACYRNALAYSGTSVSRAAQQALERVGALLDRYGPHTNSAILSRSSSK